MRNTELMDQRRPALLPPVLCYHRIGGPAELGVTRVARSVFARQMTTLARAGWKTLTLDQFAERLRPDHSALRTPHSALLLTFDDGYASLAEQVYPILADVGFTAGRGAAGDLRVGGGELTDGVARGRAWLAGPRRRAHG